MKVDINIEDAQIIRVTLLAEIEKKQILLDDGWLTDYVRAQMTEDTQTLSELLDRLDISIDREVEHEKMIAAPHTAFIGHCQEFVH
ncbi:hypothetical protein IZY60_14035 [Lutibacter sp. B2]|nr:hypothetical protein [Lutibacter sp. B2]